MFTVEPGGAYDTNKRIKALFMSFSHEDVESAIEEVTRQDEIHQAAKLFHEAWNYATRLRGVVQLPDSERCRLQWRETSVGNVMITTHRHRAFDVQNGEVTAHWAATKYVIGIRGEPSSYVPLWATAETFDMSHEQELWRKIFELSGIDISRGEDDEVRRRAELALAQELADTERQRTKLLYELDTSIPDGSASPCGSQIEAAKDLQTLLVYVKDHAAPQAGLAAARGLRGRQG
jgi:hypothetical protein